MLWVVEVQPSRAEVDREAERLVREARDLGVTRLGEVSSSRLFLLQGDLDESACQRAARTMLADPVVETFSARRMDAAADGDRRPVASVLYKPGVTDNVGQSACQALRDVGLPVSAVATGRAYRFGAEAAPAEIQQVATHLLGNDAIERVILGPLSLTTLDAGQNYQFQLVRVPIRDLDDQALMQLSKTGQLYLSLAEMQTIRHYYRDLGRDPTDIELESIAQTWSEHCSHKTLKGRIRYRDETGERHFENMLKETVFAATQTIRRQLGEADWCVSVFQDNAGVVQFTEDFHACFKVETHNHPSAIEPYGGANTGLGGVIRDPLGTGLGAKPVCNTDVFCFAPPETPYDSLPPGVLHPRTVAHGVVAGVRDYGNRMGIPTVNGAVFFDPRYLGNPLVYCGTAAVLPVDHADKSVEPGDYIVAVGGRTGRDGIHGATFSSAELTEESETVSGGAVQIGNAVAEKMMLDVILQARDQGLYRAITDCGAGGFSSAVGEMGEHTGAEVWLDRAPLKYAGLSYTEIWISEAQERMVLAVPPERWEAFEHLCRQEGVEATIIGQFTNTGKLTLKYGAEQVGELTMEFLHDGRPPVVREAVYQPTASQPFSLPADLDHKSTLLSLLGSLNICSKHWIIRQYDHEVQAGSVVKPLVGAACDGPSDAAVVRPLLHSRRGLVISNGMNPYYGDFDPYWMAAAAIDEAVRNCVAVGADPKRIAILDNFCWGNTERPETLGSLVRAALGCHDIAVAYGMPFISGKDSLNNEFSFTGPDGTRQTVAIPSSLLISAMGQMEDVHHAVTMDLKQTGNIVYLVGVTRPEFGGSHISLVQGLKGGEVPKVDAQLAPRIFQALHAAIRQGLVRSCHDLSEGGLAVAAAEMAMAGNLGLTLHLDAALMANDLNDPTVLLYSESTTRFLVEVAHGNLERWEASLQNLPCIRIGTVEAGDHFRVTHGAHQVLVDVPLTQLRQAWKGPLDWE